MVAERWVVGEKAIPSWENRCAVRGACIRVCIGQTGEYGPGIGEIVNVVVLRESKRSRPPMQARTETEYVGKRSVSCFVIP